MLRLPPETMRYLTIGAEFIGIFLAVFLLGYWLDQRVGYEPLFTILGMIAGFAGAMYRLLRTAREYEDHRRREKDASERRREGSLDEGQGRDNET